MSQIDWSKAPEGTNYRDAGGNWLRFKNNQWFAWSSASGGYWFTIGKHNLQKPLIQKIVSTVADLLDFGYLVSPTLHMQFVGRVKRDLSWSGEGPPPVGTECEFIKHNSPPAPKGRWETGKILYLSECTIVIGVDGGERVHHPRNCSYRPIRTPEQIAAEERGRSVEQMVADLRLLICSGKDFSVCEALYDAGYRKKADK